MSLFQDSRKIVVAPDKFKGTLSAQQAADIIARVFPEGSCVKAPMADGGEGTAAILCRGLQWQRRDCYFVDPHTRTAVIDSSAVIGLQSVDLASHDILKASSYPLGLKVREILKGGCDRVVIGIGGTSTCDGGMGFVEALGVEKLKSYRNSIVGLSDVEVPLVAPAGKPSALMFAPQKGASPLDMEVLERRLWALYDKYKGLRSPFDGAGGGLGFAIASLIGAECHPGAAYVIDSYDIDWRNVGLIITGEGRIDAQTLQGKVVGELTKIGRQYGIPVVAFGGTVQPGMESESIIATDRFFPSLTLSNKTAALRLEAAVREFYSSSSGLGSSGSVYHFE